jgi:hypothetical protein
VTLRCTNEKYENIVGDEEILPEKLDTSRVKEYFKGRLAMFFYYWANLQKFLAHFCELVNKKVA